MTSGGSSGLCTKGPAAVSGHRYNATPMHCAQIYLGTIPEANVTLNVVGNTNELGVIITETTFGGRGDLSGEGTGAVMSYGDLIFTTLTRATSARHAIAIMDGAPTSTVSGRLSASCGRTRC